MAITSLLFLLFSLVAAILFRILPARFRLAWLVVISLGYCATWSWQMAVIFGAVSLMDLGLGRWIGANRERRERLWMGIALNILLWIVVKYQGFFLSVAGGLLLPFTSGAAQIFVPIGISFVMLQAVMYLVDIHNGRVEALRDPLKLAAYLTFFPKLVSGPIERPRNFLQRMGTPAALDRESLKRSFTLIVVGMLRKVVIASTLSVLIPADLWSSPANYSGTILMFYPLIYAVMLYNDFAGYSSIVRGVSIWFGMELSVNFNFPYLARSFSEFWARWHVSLSSTLRDYIFFPLSRSLLRRIPNQRMWVNIVVPPLVTMLISGIWHGLYGGMILWGLMYAVFIIIERLLSFRPGAKKAAEMPLWQQILRTGLIFLLVSLAWIPFVATPPAALQIYAKIFSWSENFHPLATVLKNALLGFVDPDWMAAFFPDPRAVWVALAGVAIDGLLAIGRDDSSPLRWPRVLQGIALGIAILALVAFALAGMQSPFVYQGF